MKALILTCLIMTSLHAATWKAGNESFELSQDTNEDWASPGCEKKCEIDELAAKLLQSAPLKSEDLAGGKNPGSVICRKILGDVIYLEKGEETDAFCRLGNHMVSLSRLTRLSLN
jgi:hypothetical protein